VWGISDESQSNKKPSRACAAHAATSGAVDPVADRDMDDLRLSPGLWCAGRLVDGGHGFSIGTAGGVIINTTTLKFNQGRFVLSDEYKTDQA
jgi:hypothetical protein